MNIPVKIVLNEKTALLGAARYAQEKNWKHLKSRVGLKNLTMARFPFGRNGARLFRSARGELFARITAQMAMHGVIFLLILRIKKPIAGERMGSLAGATVIRSSVFAPAFWNGRDPILKERLFGLNAWQGNHGEDVKECYFYLDGTPSHSYMKYLYKYPQEEFPYERLREENRKRTALEPEYELIDTGIFDQSRYFDIFIEYAKASPEDICIKIEVFNRGDRPAPLDFLAQLWFRNQWAWGETREMPPRIVARKKNEGEIALIADEDRMASPKNLGFEYRLGKRYLFGPKGGELLFTDNETHEEGREIPNRYYKDGIQRYLIQKEKTVNPAKTGTKACLHYHFDEVLPKQSIVLYFRLTDKELRNPLEDVEKIIRFKKKRGG